MLDHGHEITFTPKRREKDRNGHWLDWCRKAFLELPGNQATTDELCAALQADTNIAPRLDQRLDTGRRSGARWRRNLIRALPRLLGVTKTGEKRGRLSVYHYDPEAGELLAAAAKRRRRSCTGKREASMPHLRQQQ
ncbi:hypothetical protein HXX76_014601 [Chlamydomonas incerta]|uniref:Uncharacterized protein n=1 Tax=Chlamydomonas incerta TaxID=51695 RepID=A0A835VPH6_CHLIN|nr:hypothetical protein HXX76_014601 [Chlamydomonas incerta]|eukprot:KAG2424392.1 hypothetical protein HXX76_014601 [Chlamydomonas incerta]